MISINAIIFSDYMIDEVYCENRSHPRRHGKHSFGPPDIRIAIQGPVRRNTFFKSKWLNDKGSWFPWS